MAGDLDYQSDVQQILQEFAQADLETLHLDTQGTNNRGV
jgi:hypothetical protein